MMQALKTAAGLSAFIAFALAASYCSEAPKYRFQHEAAEVGKQMPGARLISALKSVDLASPVSWFWAPTTTLNYAMPDPLMQGRFYLMSMLYEEREPNVFLLDVDCEEHNAVWYDQDEPETAFPARDTWGEPVIAPNHKTYRRSKIDMALPTAWLHAFCETDWTAERNVVGAAVFKK